MPSKEPENKRWNFQAEHVDPATGTHVVRKFYGPESLRGYAESMAKEDRAKVKVSIRRRRV